MYAEFAFTFVKNGIYGVFGFFGVAVILVFYVLTNKIKRANCCLSIPFMLIGFFAVGMLLLTAIFFSIAVFLKEFCTVLNDFSTDAAKFD